MTHPLRGFRGGGVHPHDEKLTAASPVRDAGVPPIVAIPLAMHVGKPAKPLVKAGDPVKTGQLIGAADGFISANVHSSVTGTVAKVEEILDVNGRRNLAVQIKALAEDEWAEGIDPSPEIRREIVAGPDEIRERVRACGVVGMGGATFPTHVKLSVPEGKKVERVLINGSECEPFLTADHRLMLERGEELMIGIRLILKALSVARAELGIEDNKKDAIEALSALAERYPEIEVRPLRTRYPQGGERQLVQALTGREIPPPPGLPIDVGCAVFNVATAFAIYEAVQKGRPLTRRIVTVTGRGLGGGANLDARVGTPISALLELCGAGIDGIGKVVVGGPMMGKAIPSIEAPVTKGSSGVLLIGEAEAARKEIRDCIRCGRCVGACPLGLEPYLLMALSQRYLWERAGEERVMNCCECSCCTFACPANRPLLDYIKLGKQRSAALARAKAKAGK
jgi:Na+-translocating ferredoxin:NAD+ oxidoreductase subunit C